MQEVNAVCDKVIIINNGRIVASDSVDNLSKRMSGKLTLIARIVGKQDEILPVLKTIDGIKGINVEQSNEPNSADYIIDVEEDVDIRQEVFYKLSEIKKPLIMFKNLSYSLEEIFLKVTKQSIDTANHKKIPNSPKEEKQMKTIYLKELRTYFTSAVGYIFLGFSLIISGVFASINIFNTYADMSGFLVMFWVVLLFWCRF